jgi:hypothetical protein
LFSETCGSECNYLFTVFYEFSVLSNFAEKKSQKQTTGRGQTVTGGGRGFRQEQGWQRACDKAAGNLSLVEEVSRLGV